MLGGFLEKGPEALIALGFIRERRHGPFDHRDLRRLAPLLPHLHRATRIQRRLAGLEAVRGGAIVALQRLALGVLLLDERGRHRSRWPTARRHAAGFPARQCGSREQRPSADSRREGAGSR